MQTQLNKVIKSANFILQKYSTVHKYLLLSKKPILMLCLKKIPLFLGLSGPTMCCIHGLFIKTIVSITVIVSIPKHF